MKVLDLRCAHGHGFEGWFGSEADFQDQHARGLVACPACGDTAVAKLLSAPRLNLGAAPPLAVPRKAGAPDASAPAPRDGTADAPSALPAPVRDAIHAAWLGAVRQVLARTEDVGARFAEEARRIHYGEAAERGIRGSATAREAEALLDEGIAVLPLPVPDGLDGPLH